MRPAAWRSACVPPLPSRRARPLRGPTRTAPIDHTAASVLGLFLETHSAIGSRPIMSDHILLGTRKGTLIIDRKSGKWTPRPIAHAGISISYAARDPRDGTMWAAMDHAHWGPKLSRSKDEGATWENLTQIAYP